MGTTTDRGHFPNKGHYPERRSNQTKPAQKEMGTGDMPTHEVTALNPKTGQKGTIGVGWIKHGSEGTYLSISLMPFVVIDAGQDAIINVFERDYVDRRAKKEERLNERRPHPVENVERPHLAAAGSPDRLYREYMDGPDVVVLRPSEFGALYEQWMSEAATQGKERELIWPSDFVIWTRDKRAQVEQLDAPKALSGAYADYLKWGIDDPAGTFTYLEWLEHREMWNEYVDRAENTEPPLSFREWLAAKRQAEERDAIAKAAAGANPPPDSPIPF
jgi:hypothetical protein